MRFEIVKVSNGYIVIQLYSRNTDSGGISDISNAHVFKTFGQAAWWMDRQFKGQK